MSFIRDNLNKKLQDPRFKEAWDNSELEYQIQRQIIAQRNQRGLTQSELAQRLNTSQSVIARIENGKQNITIGNLNNIANALGCKVKVTFEEMSGPPDSSRSAI